MAKKTVYSAPESIGPAPDFSEAYVGEGDDRRFDYQRYIELTDAWNEKLRQWCKKRSKSPLAGKIVRIPWADGVAEYMVINVREFVHLPHGDAWNVPAYMIDGLDAAAIKSMAA